MKPERRNNDEEVREFQLEGTGLVMVCVAAAMALIIAFFVGRWYERRLHPTGPAVTMADGRVIQDRSGVESGEVSAEDGLTYFDTVEGGQKESEPGRQARTVETGSVSTGTTEPAREEQPVLEQRRGPWFVQVFAGRDRTSAERLVATLEEKGYPVKMQTVREGQGALYKVKIGGYPEREDASKVAEELKRNGFPGAWIPPIN